MNRLCAQCGGKGFFWKSGFIKSRATGKKIATTYKHGEKCLACNGTGQADLSGWLAGALALGIGALGAIGYIVMLLFSGG